MVAMKSGVFKTEDTRLMDAFFEVFYNGLEYRCFIPGSEKANHNMIQTVKRHPKKLRELVDLIIEHPFLFLRSRAIF